LVRVTSGLADNSVLDGVTNKIQEEAEESDVDGISDAMSDTSIDGNDQAAIHGVPVEVTIPGTFSIDNLDTSTLDDPEKKAVETIIEEAIGTCLPYDQNRGPASVSLFNNGQIVSHAIRTFGDSSDEAKPASNALQEALTKAETRSCITHEVQESGGASANDDVKNALSSTTATSHNLDPDIKEEPRTKAVIKGKITLDNFDPRSFTRPEQEDEARKIIEKAIKKELESQGFESERLGLGVDVTFGPSPSPSKAPSSSPSRAPVRITSHPTVSPNTSQTDPPSRSPTKSPSVSPSSKPTIQSVEVHYEVTVYAKTQEDASGGIADISEDLSKPDILPTITDRIQEEAQKSDDPGIADALENVSVTDNTQTSSEGVPVEVNVSGSLEVSDLDMSSLTDLEKAEVKGYFEEALEDVLSILSCANIEASISTDSNGRVVINYVYAKFGETSADANAVADTLISALFKSSTLSAIANRVQALGQSSSNQNVRDATASASIDSHTAGAKQEAVKTKAKVKGKASVGNVGATPFTDEQDQESKKIVEKAIKTALTAVKGQVNYGLCVR